MTESRQPLNRTAVPQGGHGMEETWPVLVVRLSGPRYWSPTGLRTPAEGDKLLIIFDGGKLNQDQVDRLVVAQHELAAAQFFGIDQLADVLPAPAGPLSGRVRPSISRSSVGRSGSMIGTTAAGPWSPW